MPHLLDQLPEWLQSLWMITIVLQFLYLSMITPWTAIRVWRRIRRWQRRRSAGR